MPTPTRDAAPPAPTTAPTAALAAPSSNDVARVLHTFMDHRLYSLAKDQYSATVRDAFMSLALTIRDRLTERWIATQQRYYKKDAKRVYYLSAEFLLGRALYNNLVNLGLYDTCKEAMKMAGFELDDLLEQEIDAGLGNGGLGRLAACFLDSMATLRIPGYGYGIRYEFGMFDQEIRDGYQMERPDEWLRFGNPWEVARPEYVVPVHFGGRVEEYLDDTKQFRVRWTDTQEVLGVPYDTPIAGYGQTANVNTLRLWRARASSEFDLSVFNDGDYEKAVLDKNRSETISKVLYPSDTKVFGKELRLKQQYFFVACSLHDILRRHLSVHENFDTFADKVAIQLNDTHPAVAIPELMRLFVDVHGLAWDKAWDLVTRTFGYTNHTLLAEALETWPVELFGSILPRHLSIIMEVNRRFLRQVMSRFPYDDGRLARMSLIDEGQGEASRRIRMAHVAVVGSHSVNGVAALHTELLKSNLMHDFHEMWPERFNNKTNGVTPRRWLLAANRPLAAAITERIGDGWITDLDQLAKLVPFADDKAFRDEVRAIKAAAKKSLAEHLAREYRIVIDPATMFDVQVKRIHEYKRQLLNLLHCVALYLRIKQDPTRPVVPRTVIFGGKAAPAYVVAKNIIKLINAVSDVINGDPQVRGKLKVVFLPNYRVSLAERIFPASDLSEQISTAGKEASGTGNMKFALNGALTIGTLDGANIEIRDEVGQENFFLFGLTAQEVEALRRDGYRPRDYYAGNAELKRVLDLIAAGFFSPEQPELFRPLVQSLLDEDRYMLLADFASYVECQEKVSAAYLDEDAWARKAVLNIARMGRFSSDRTIQEYAREIWRTEAV